MTTTEHVHTWSEWQSRTVTETRTWPLFRQRSYEIERRKCSCCDGVEQHRVRP